MPTFEIVTVSKSAHSYFVEAKNKKDAEELFWNGYYDDDKPKPDYEVDAEEEIVEIDKISKI